MARNGQLDALAAAIISRTSSSNRAILMGHSLGALVAAQMLQMENV
jgi:pimeloyl-ACP methyl ester carboxylesterase